MSFLNISTSVDAWPKGEETFSTTVWVSGINYPVVILMGAVLVGMLVVWWRSKRNQQ